MGHRRMETVEKNFYFILSLSTGGEFLLPLLYILFGLFIPCIMIEVLLPSAVDSCLFSKTIMSCLTASLADCCFVYRASFHVGHAPIRYTNDYVMCGLA